jgi:hypothetical protein
VLYDWHTVVLAGTFLIALLLRSAAGARAYLTSNINIVKINVYSETLVFFVYAAVFVVALCSVEVGIWVPASMLIISSISVAAYIFLAAIKRGSLLQQDSNILVYRRPLGAWFAKLYEDLFLTLPPFFLSFMYSSSVAGTYRLMVTLIKGGSKVFPFRYELILRATAIGIFDEKVFTRLSLVFTLMGFCAYLLVHFGVFNDLQFRETQSAMFAMLVASGPVITLLVIFPLAVLKVKHLFIFTACAFVFTFGMPFFVGGKESVGAWFAIANVTLWFWLLTTAKVQIFSCARRGVSGRAHG